MIPEKLLKRAMAIGLLLLAASVAQAENLLSVVVDGSPADVQKAIDAGAQVIVRNNYGWTPLMNAVGHNEDIEVTELLLSAGANVNARGEAFYHADPMILAKTAEQSRARAVVARRKPLPTK